jgi:hypothetical protein
MRHRSFFRNVFGNSTGKWNTLIGTTALAAGFVLFAGAPGAKADSCRDRLVHADHKLHEAVEHHGYQSKQADNARHELHEAREYCWSHEHKWWDVDGNRWHTDRDWDDHDHDHDRDHDHH